VPLDVDLVPGEAVELGREAARRSVLGLGIGGDASRLVLVLAAASGHPYIEARPAEARTLGHAAARVASRRPIAEPASRGARG
jgi:hypothetical protein